MTTTKTTTETEFVNLTPVIADENWSPHALVIKEFIEGLSITIRDYEAATISGTDAAYGLLDYVANQLRTVRNAASHMLADDFFLLIDGKRQPGKSVGDK